MKTKNECACFKCSQSGIFLGIIFGIAAAILFSLGLLPLIFINGIWVTFSIGIAAFVYILILASIGSFGFSKLTECLIRNLRCLITGSLGLTFFSIFLLVILQTATSLLVTVTIGILTFFLVFLIASLVSFIKCLVY